MAKRRKKTSEKFPLPFVALGVILLIAAALIFFFQQNGAGTPDVAVEPERIDYGDVKLDTELAFEFTVTNRGEGVLRFKEEPYIEILEGC